MRASDILMDRVWQLETETFKDTAGFVFARITDTVDPKQDPTALHPEIQRQLPSVRTDLDRFSDVEMSSLIRQGYCVARKVCREHPGVFGSELPSNPPWDPIGEKHVVASSLAEMADSSSQQREPIAVTQAARTLHASAVRRIWSTLLDYRDWPSYVYVPVIVPILVLLPYFVLKSYERSRRINQVVESLAQGSRDLQEMTRLMEGPASNFVGEKDFEEIRPGERVDLTGFVILQDLRIIDLRNWRPSGAGSNDSDSFVYGYRRLKVQKLPENTKNNLFRVSLLALSPDTQVRFPPQQLKPKLYSQRLESASRGEKLTHWEVGADFQKVPAGDSVDIIYEHSSPGLFLRDGLATTTLSFDVEAETVELTRWLLLPQGKEYRSYNLVRYKSGQPETAENVKVVTEYLADDFTILAFKLLSLKPGYTYEIIWSYQ